MVTHKLCGREVELIEANIEVFTNILAGTQLKNNALTLLKVDGKFCVVGAGFFKAKAIEIVAPVAKYAPSGEVSRYSPVLSNALEVSDELPTWNHSDDATIENHKSTSKKDKKLGKDI